MSPIVNPSVFREYDIRGVAERDLPDDFAQALGRAYGTVITRGGGRRVAVGRDCRLSSDRIFVAFVDGVRAAGVDVIDIGVVPTPLLYFAIPHLSTDGGVIITGSHNPAPDNGFKLCVGTAALHGAGIGELREIIEAGDYAEGVGTLDRHAIAADYHAWVVGNIAPGPRPLKVVVDGGNGTGGPVGSSLYRALGFEVIELFCEMDGRFPNHHPDPTVEKNLEALEAAVAAHGADLGIAFDGDADRIGAVDGRGRVIWGDQLMVFFSRAVLEAEPGATIVSEVKCSRVLFDDIAQHGGRPIMWKVGHSLIKAKMKETGALLAGEMSGHIFFKHRYFGFDDAVYSGARLLELLSRTDRSLAEMVDELPPTVTTPEIRVHCADETKFGVVARAAAWFGVRYDVVDIDGVRINFPSGWGLIRPSNTQPVLVMRFEADTEAHLAQNRETVEAWIRAHAPEVDLDRGE